MSYSSPVLAEFGAEWIDLDLEQHARSNNLFLGWNEDDPDFACGFADWESADEQIIPRAEWPERIAAIDAMGSWTEKYIAKIKNQGREPSCVYNAASQALEIIWNRTFDVVNWIELSAISGYRWNGNMWSGSNVGQSANWLAGTGLLPVSSERNLAFAKAGIFAATHPATGYSAKFADGWKSTADDFRTHEWIRLTTVEQWVSAQLKGFPCVGGRNGHCICHVRPVIDQGKLLSIYVNSWGAWGNTLNISSGPAKGFGMDSEGLIKTMVARGAWALRTVRRPTWIDNLRSLTSKAA